MFRDPLYLLHDFFQFVRDTVRNFYRRFKGGSNGLASSLAEVCPSEDGLTHQLLVQNEALKQSCGAVQLELVRQALEDARIYIDKLIDIMYDTLNIVMDLIQLSSIVDPIMAKKVSNPQMPNSELPPSFDT